MNSFATVLVCLASVAYVSAGFFNFGIPIQRQELVEMSGDAVWVEPPVNANSFPKFSQYTSESTNGETLTEMCKFVVENGKLPWAIPQSNAEYVPFAGAAGQDYSLPQFPTVDVILEFCKTMQKHNGHFIVPKNRLNL